MRDPVAAAVVLDRGREGVARRTAAGVVVRAERGPVGPLLLRATQRGAAVTVAVEGSPATPADAAEVALEEALDWIGARDDGDVGQVVSGHSRLESAARRLGPVRLSRLPRVQEAVGRAVLGMLVQRIEGERSAAQFARLLGAPAPEGLWCWPAPEAVARTPAHRMRRCGISRRGAAVLHGVALDAPKLEAVRDDPHRFDARLRSIRGLGVWTCGEARRLLGDPDAVPLGDDGLPAIVCHAMAGTPPEAATDEQMLELLAPYEGQRGRVVALIVRGAFSGVLPRPPRRAPRAALSVHRYW